jgi:hypothetical protein
MNAATPTVKSCSAARVSDGEQKMFPVRLVVDVVRPTVAYQPVTAGIPFARSVLPKVLPLVLNGPAGHAATVQAEALARWPDGSVKWLLLDFILPPGTEGSSEWFLTPSVDQSPPQMGVTEGDAALIIDTGAVKFFLDRTGFGFAPFNGAWLDGRDIVHRNFVFTLCQQRFGPPILPRLHRIAPEPAGPVRTTVCCEGTLGGGRFLARVCFFAGTGLVRLRLTLHNPEAARHRSGLWDLGDAGSMLLRELSLHLGLASPGRSRLTWTVEPGAAVREQEADRFEISQVSSGGDNWQNKNHCDATGRVPHDLRGYRVHCNGSESTGLRASPVVALHGPAASLTVAVPEFWQQFPQSIKAGSSWLKVDFLPNPAVESCHELQGGEQKTFRVWFHVGRPGTPLSALDWVHNPAVVRAAPEWYAASGAVPCLLPAREDPDDRLQTLLSAAISGDNSFFARREIIDEYGWRNYGEIYADHEAAYYQGPKPVVSHYNNQYDVVFGALLQFWRTGDRRWFDLLDPLSRHVIDIDIYHTTRDRAAYCGGLFWHTDHYCDAATCTHRAYSKANRRPGASYGGGPSNEHNYTTGLLHYYYITGDPNARNAVLELADWVVGMDDGSRTLLGILDDGPTGLASATRHADYHGPGRGAGNSVNALLDGWLLSGKQPYLDRAEALLRRCIHPADDVAGRDLLNVEDRWSYTVFLSVLARYLDLKAETGRLDEMYAYGRASLLTYARWMLEHEAPYFAHPEKLEYPTETWAAQEFRKANVYRLAARHADESLREQLWQRGGEFAERAWRDLLRFPSRTAVRPLAILMTEGTRDAFFQARGLEPARGPRQSSPFPMRETFVTQKQRIKALLTGRQGFARSLRRLADYRRWRRYLFGR